MITVLMGAPGSGKSTWVQNHYDHGTHIFDIDAVRTRPGIDVQGFTRYERIKAIKAAQLGVDVIADATHLMPGHRAIWLQVAKELGIETKIIAFDTPLRTLLKIQRERAHPAPDKVVVDHHRRFQMQKHVINREPWSYIEVIVRGIDDK
jgi:predicted kinase